MHPSVQKLRTGVRKALQVYPGPVRRIRATFQPRSTHVFCVGAPKTGTVSVANIFSAHFRARHEPYTDQSADWLEARLEGRASDHALVRWLHQRDAVLWLECEAFHAMAWFSDLLSREFEEARFILTVRDCSSWLDSIINQHINVKEAGPAFEKLRRLYHGEDAKPVHPLLQQHGLYSLEGYLSYWARHNTFVMDHVPSDRLLVLPVNRLTTDLDRVADFAGVGVDTLSREASHSHRASRKHHILAQLDPVEVSEEIKRICGPTIRRLQEYEFVQGYNLSGKMCIEAN